MVSVVLITTCLNLIKTNDICRIWMEKNNISHQLSFIMKKIQKYSEHVEIQKTGRRNAKEQ